MDNEVRELQRLVAQGHHDAYFKLCAENCRQGQHEWSKYTNVLFSYDFDKIVKPLYPTARNFGAIFWIRKCFWCGIEQRKVTFDIELKEKTGPDTISTSYPRREIETLCN